MTMPVRGKDGRRFRGRCAARAVLGLALPAIAGLAWWLGAIPAAAQPKQPEAGVGAPASVDLADRKQLMIVGSTTLKPITDAIIKHLVEAYVLPEPIERFEGTRVGLAAFCDGVGPQYPDIVAASDRMDRGEFESCIENKVLDVIEVEAGDSAVVVVTKTGDPVFDLTPRMVYYAAAESMPADGEFKHNQNKSWNDTNEDAPDLPIRLIIPAKGGGTRSFFDDNFMEGGCRHVKEIDAIFAAAERVPRCITLRDDGPVTEVPEGDIVDALIKAPPGALAVISWLVYLNNRDKLDVLPISSVMPSHENIANDSYEMSVTLRYYFKRAHMMQKYGGQGFIQGIREFMLELVKDEASGEDGYLEKLGLVALEPQDRRKQQDIARRLERFQP
jgi:phosphate transport system substrate-binding protein